MIVNTVEPKKKYKDTQCQKCRRIKTCTWHHLHRRRYGKEWVWVCIDCHDNIHRNPKENSEFYLKHKPEIMKKTKKKKCKHGASYNDKNDGYKKKCHFCDEEIRDVL